jgi:hypothetical protein
MANESSTKPCHDIGGVMNAQGRIDLAGVVEATCIIMSSGARELRFSIE